MSAGPQLPSAGHQSVNSTKNLENLSRLFRQLRPHLLQTVSREARVSHHLSRPELRGQVQLDAQREGREEKEPPRPGAYFPSKKGSSHGFEDAGRGLQSQVRQLPEEHVRVRRTSAKDHCNTSHMAHPPSPGNLEQLSGPTNHDRSAPANGRTSCSSLSSSPATSSWESFSKPMKLSEREREYGGQHPAHSEFKEAPKVSIDGTLPEAVSGPGPSHYDSLLKSLAEERKPHHTAKRVGSLRACAHHTGIVYRLQWVRWLPWLHTFFDHSRIISSIETKWPHPLLSCS